MEPYAWEHEEPDAPRPAEVMGLEAFLNTVDRQTFGGHAAKPPERRDLLLLDPGPLAADVERARALRDGLRAWLEARQGLEHDDTALHRAREVLADLNLHVDLGADEAALTPRAGLDGLVADLATAQASGTLRRLKICAAADCRFVYYDASRSRTQRWCAMEVCGNRVKTRRYRQRH
jgi:predicted RNA-binding Zn ribbon-like protein